MIKNNLDPNLSFSFNLPKTTVHSEDIKKAVDETLSKFYCKTLFREYFFMYDIYNSVDQQNKGSGIMLSEKTILCETNADLWDKALRSAIASITEQTYPHYLVIQELINFLLNGHLTDFGLVEEFFWKLLLSHPPKLKLEYYWPILHDNFIIVNGKKTEEQSLFFWLIETLLSCFKSKEFVDENEDLYFNEINANQTHSQQFLEVINNFHGNALSKLSACQSNKKSTICFEKFTIKEKIKRCLIALNFVYNIFEMDFAFWFHLKELKLSSPGKDERPLLSLLLWPEVRNIGIINKEIHQIISLYMLIRNIKYFSCSQINVIKKLFNLLAELIRFSDIAENPSYPFLGVKSNGLARELSVHLHLQLQEKCKVNDFSTEEETVLDFKPPWFRLLLCSHLLSFFTGYQCTPDLSGAYDILEHIAFTNSLGEESKPNVTKTSKTKIDPKIVQRLKKCKSVNAKLFNGLTLLQHACEKENLEEVKALLTFREIDINAKNNEGWTALHIAAYKGNVDIVKELLLYKPNSSDLLGSINTRTKGPDGFTPLMCAANKGHGEVCRLLLNHTGSVLLEDINDANQTALELSDSKEVANITKLYKDNIVWTVHSHKNMSFSENFKEIVIKLCIEMIQSYFCTHRIWDVYRALKRKGKDPLIKNPESVSNIEPQWDYMRYHRDIKTNIYKLRRLIPKLVLVQEFKSSHEIFIRILSFNKSC